MFVSTSAPTSRVGARTGAMCRAARSRRAPKTSVGKAAQVAMVLMPGTECVANVAIPCGGCEAANAMNDVSRMLAANADDFGGYTIPALSLIVIAAIILALSPPLRE
ncbi:hypothetical protein CDCA_CDCA01G0386 [Cyanidium caldarium]|uniref:Uncharacterized protein n=1 Tax=Cyanidium caldarium TaxID=2771 RepID=A0AAV9IQL8_CYACA|nr:hypothetical protein CDCA_CDCA01G0386 [Cyanidium caldarium]